MDTLHILERLDKVMQVEATVPSKGNFMLTHVPFDNLFYGVNTPIKEEDLLQNILLAKPEKHKLIMVQGDNGSGKSHLIRWLYERYRESVNEEKEKVMLISRAHNTLQDTLMQLLNTDIFPEDIRKNELEKIQNAQSAISGKELRKTVNFNFTLVIEDDFEKKVNNAAIQSAYMPMLVSYLKNDYILNIFMMRSGGPLDRICAKLNNVDNLSSNNYEGDVFSAKDFDISLDQIKNHLEQGDNAAGRQTISFARKLYQSLDFRQQVASYMNSKVNDVIQKSLKLNTADFQQLFASLRIQLKKQGMRLSLFIEDINAFTGIDLALMEVLLANHEAVGNEDFCRICSVVGSTIDFYRNRLNESIKERVQQNGAAIFIREESLFGSDEKLISFAAKYINACYLTDEQVSQWEENGCDSFSMPIAEKIKDFSNVECFGNNMTIFPFNEKALVNMYRCLNSHAKTPRRFLLDVIYPVVSHYYTDNDVFLRKESDFLNDSITSLPNFNTNDAVNFNKIGGDDKERRSILLRIWGDGTIAVKGDTLGGLKKEVFETFGIDMMFEAFQKISRGEEVQELENGGSSDDSSDNKNGQTGSSILDPTKIDPEQTKIEKAVAEWLKSKGKPLASDLEMRGLISKFIYGNMNWDAEEIPRKVVETFVGDTNKYISIEGNQNINESGIILKKTEESQELFYALIKYKYEGKNSWNFNGGLEWYRIASTWLFRHKNEIIEIMKPVYYNQHGYDEMLIWSLYIYRIFNGGLDTGCTNESILINLLNQDFKSDGAHGEDWVNIRTEINKVEAPKKCLENVYSIFSNSIGTAEAGETKYTFIDAAHVLSIISDMKHSDWNLKTVVIPGQDLKKNDLWTKPVKVIHSAAKTMNEAVKNEKIKTDEYLDYFSTAIGDYTDTHVVESVFEKIEQYLRFLVKIGLSYEDDNLSHIIKLSYAKSLSSGLVKIKKVQQASELSEKLSVLSFDPFDSVEQLYIEFKYLDKVIKEKNSFFRSKIDNDANNGIENCRKEILRQIDRMVQTSNLEV